MKQCALWLLSAAAEFAFFLAAFQVTLWLAT